MTSPTVCAGGRCGENFPAFRRATGCISGITLRTQALPIGHVVASGACSTPPSAIGQLDGVNRVVWMTARAVRLPRVNRWSTHSAHDILSSGHRFKMRRIHAHTVTTQVIKHEGDWDWSHEPLVHQSMSKPAPACQLYLRVGIAVESAAVFPATGVDTADNSRHEALERLEVIEPLGQRPAEKLGKIRSSGQLLSDQVE